MLRLIKLPSRTFAPPKSVWDVVYINKNHQPTRAATRRENWARHGQISKVKVQEIVPTVKEYQLEARAEYEWFDTLHDLEDRKSYDERRTEVGKQNKIKRHAEGMAKQKVYDKRFITNMNQTSIHRKKEKQAEAARYGLFDALCMSRVMINKVVKYK
jgi:hypothetical protein